MVTQFTITLPNYLAEKILASKPISTNRSEWIEELIVKGFEVNQQKIPLSESFAGLDPYQDLINQGLTKKEATTLLNNKANSGYKKAP
ncbi:MAG: hypothetical protein Q8O89_00615 [Nanoarchaeota archaeon]|nr:hypothetical protein [Nanoarchaeota archaeon]